MYPGYYFTGDGANRDKDGYYWITGRVDGMWFTWCDMVLQNLVLFCIVCGISISSPSDVLNISGHRIGSAEVESALVVHPAIAEAAVIGIPHEITG